MNCIISFKQKKSNFTAKLFGARSHKNKAGAAYLSGTVVAKPVF